MKGPSCDKEANDGKGPLVGLLTGGDDRSYAHGLAVALAADVSGEFVGSDAAGDFAITHLFETGTV